MSAELDRLLKIMALLRDPKDGCPWDIAQDFSSIAPYTVEEAYEVTDAIERGDMDDLREELGDLLLQVVFHAQMASEKGLYDFAAVAEGISDKLTRRHPHVFGDKPAGNAAEQHRAWEAHKAAEREASGKDEGGLLASITPNLPALTLALKTSKKAASVGFDWDNADQVVEKVNEELAELAAARTENDAAHIEEELGDLLLAVTNLARHLKIDPERALRSANRKFTRRFERLEQLLASQNTEWSELDIKELEKRWQQIK